jgi:uncharacterized membrane protein
MKLPYQIYKPAEIAMWTAMIASWLASFFFYRAFPAEVPIHWNMAGQPDDWSGPGFAAFFFPAVITGIYLLMTLLPLADPQKKRYMEFGRPYTILRLTLVLFMTMIYFVASSAGIGYRIDMNLIMPFAVGSLFIVIGNFMPKFKKNWFVGIRTPWTLSDERVWTKTHRVGGRLFIIGGLLLMLTAFLPLWLRAPALLAAVALVVLGTVGYSYFIWRKLKSEKAL